MGDYDESKHARDDHGKFTAGGAGMKAWVNNARQFVSAQKKSEAAKQLGAKADATGIVGYNVSPRSKEDRDLHRQAGEAHLEAARAIQAVAKQGPLSSKGPTLGTLNAQAHLQEAQHHANMAGDSWDSKKYPRDDQGNFFKSQKKAKKYDDDKTRRMDDEREAQSEEDWRGPRRDPAAERRAEAGRGPGYTPPDPSSRRSRRRGIKADSSSY